jgi:hypothetical protein
MVELNEAADRPRLREVKVAAAQFERQLFKSAIKFDMPTSWLLGADASANAMPSSSKFQLQKPMLVLILLVASVWHCSDVNIML